MQYDVDTPEQYLAVLEDDWRRVTLLALRRLILEIDPTIIEYIRYKMLCDDDDRGPVLGLNAQKGYVSLYVGNTEKVDPEGLLLEGLDCGKGCIRFKKSHKVEATQIDCFLQRVFEIRRNGGDIDC